MDDLIFRKSVAEKMKNRRDYVGRPSDPDCIIADEPSVPAVPLDKLCEYLSVTCACPPNKEEIQKRCLTAQCALCWKESITKWMEGQDAAD